MTALALGLTVLLSYLVGSIPFGYLIARGRGVNILQHGSGNIGATNVGRVLGRPYGVLVFFFDFAKGALPTLLARMAASERGWALPPDSLPAAAAVAAFLGHLFPIYLHFRGGKGVATAAGAVCVLLPGPMLAAFVAWLAVALATRYVSLASLTAAVALCGFRFFTVAKPWDDEHRIATLFCLIAALLIFLRHRANIDRLMRGNENRLKETPAMLHFSKIIHVLALGLWFGSVLFFSFVVGLNLFGTFETVASAPPKARPLWFPLWELHDGDAPDPSLPNPLRKEQGTQAAGVAIAPLFTWYFGIQSVCALLAAATAFAWRNLGERVHRLRAGILLAALLTVGIGWWLDRTVHRLRVPRNETFLTMVSHSPPRESDVHAAVEARTNFVRWHLASLGLNMLTVLLVTVAMGQAAFLPGTPKE